MHQTSRPLDHAARQAPSWLQDQLVFFVQALGSVAGVLLQTGIFFYTHRQFGWGLSRNLMLASGQGAFYVCGALLAGRVAERLGRRRTLLWVEFGMAAFALLCLAMPTPAWVTALLLAYTTITAVQWPVLESWASAGSATGSHADEARRLSQRLTRYNVVWAGVNAITLAGSGAVIQLWPAGVFVLAGVSNVLAGILVLASRRDEQAASTHHASPEPEPELAAVRTEAMWLSRIALPSSYVVAYSLAAMLPLLPSLLPLSTLWRTVAGSTWFIARWGTFAVLGHTLFWHTRPRLMLIATAAMLVAFLGVTIRPTDIWPGAVSTEALDLTAMIAWQIILGAAMGVIYAASLYFGMVLSQGSTEHGGYHEALIGLGSTLGPAAAAVAHNLDPNGVRSSAATVGGIIAISLAVACVVSVISRRRRSGDSPDSG